ncbi:hypothetical protein CKALI_11815 [Corynebacterium kalinowskii]|uniref:2'-5' RNA ligase n=2 Tax=Corynebacterium kalinowskii TaxID=2675216 RepID=A0A6B8VTC0_9CORY|nr:hypothetical protein CKALI_11815 [Corynebacterium kalinowskii]
MNSQVVERAAELLPPLIPAEFTRVGTVIFGTKSKRTIAWLLEASDEMEAAARELSALNPDGRGDRWTPHLTIGLRLPRDVVPDYLAALDELEQPRSFTAVTAAYWRPEPQILQVIGGKDA